MAPFLLFAALILFDTLYWWPLARPRLALERRLRTISPLTFYLVPVPYLIRAGVLGAYIAFTGAPVLDGLAADLPAGLAVGLALVVVQTPFLLRHPPSWPRDARERVDAGVFLFYAVFVIALVEETLFRGALLLAVGGGWLALVGSSVAMAAWHLPYYVTTLHVTRRSDLVRSLTLITVVSLVFGLAVLATGSLWASILPHGLGDFVGHVPRRRSPEGATSI